jgi:hypothetical protein
MVSILIIESFSKTAELKLKLINVGIGGVLENIEKNFSMNEKSGEGEQFKFMVTWALENTFQIENRVYKDISSDIHAFVNKEISGHLKISHDGLELRNDTNSFQTAFAYPGIQSKNIGKWYYEITLLSFGIMQIGFACKNCNLDADEVKILF